jgi:3-oxoacyl-[acyl-carrier protein] reductase
MIDTGFENRMVLITGGNHGIGAATARVFITYLRLSPLNYGIDPEEARRASEPGLPLYHATQTRSGDAVVGEIRKGGGMAESWETETPPDTIFSTSAESVDRHFAVNTRAAVLLIAELVRRHKERSGRWGRVINVSTDAAQNFGGQISYGASRAATEAFTRSVATEVGPLGITVNSVAPGPVQSGYITRESEKELLPEIPLRRIGEPEDIADAIVFLASEQARWITGQVIKVSGGHAI